MVAIVSGNSLGLSLSSLAVLGQRGLSGSAGQGRSGEGAYVNAATGNLVLQTRDELLLGRGPDVLSLRTYNSQGLLDDDNADNWSVGAFGQRIVLSGAVATVGSTLTRTDRDGAQAVYTWDAGRNLYVSTDGSGAFDTIAHDAGADQFVWTDGDTGLIERYQATGQGRLISVTDADGNTVSYAYNANGTVQSVTDANGEVTHYDYSGNQLTQIRSVGANGAALTHVRYGYDASGRLESVTVDLSPEDGSIADGRTYVTTYTYDGASNRVASVTQSDGTTLAFSYVLSGGVYKVATVTDAFGAVTRFSYDAAQGATTVTDPLGAQSVYLYDAQGQLLQMRQGVTPNHAAGVSQISYAYDAAGNVTRVTDGEGHKVDFTYDARGNLLKEVDSEGDTRVRTYGEQNQLLTDTVYADAASATQAAALPETGRYVYAQGNPRQLRFSISAQGNVAEYRYDSHGQRISTIEYRGGAYDTTGLAQDAVPTEAQLVTWQQAQNLAQTRRTDYAYDGRGALSSSTVYAEIGANGQGMAASAAVTQYIYDPRGLLLQRIEPGDAAAITSYTYDGMGRVLSVSAPSLDGGVTPNTTISSYDDANGKTTVTLVNGLVTTSAYDRAGRLVSVTQQSAGTGVLGTTSYFYDQDGNLLMTQDPTGVRKWMLYDEADRKIADIDATGAMVEYAYNANGQLRQTIAYSIKVDTAALVDAAGRPTTAWSLANAATQLASLRPASSAQDQKVWSFYDEANRLVFQVDAAGYVTQTTYDGASRVLSTTRLANPIDVLQLEAVLASGVGGVPIPPVGSAPVQLGASVVGDFYIGASAPIYVNGTVTDPGHPLTGTYSFFDGQTLLGTVSAAPGTPFYAGLLPLGARTLTVVYSGDSYNAGGTTSLAVNVQPLPSELGLNISGLGTNNHTTNEPLVLTATVRPVVGGIALLMSMDSVAATTYRGQPLLTPPASGTVTFYRNGVAIGTAELVDGVASFTTGTLPLGRGEFSVSYSGDANHSVATPTVGANPITIWSPQAVETQGTLELPAELHVGSSATLSVTLRSQSGSPPSGTVSFLNFVNNVWTEIGTASVVDGRAVLSGVAVTSAFNANIRAVYSGDVRNGGLDLYAFASLSADLAATTVTVSTSSASVAQGETLTLTAQIIGAQASGVVTFYNGSTVLGTAVAVNGVATLQVNTLPTGANAIRAAYAGDGANYASTSTQALAIDITAGSEPTTPLNPIGSEPVQLGASVVGDFYIGASAPIYVSGTVTDPGHLLTGTYSFFDGQTLLGTVSAAPGTPFYAGLLPLGARTLTVVYSGDSYNAGGTTSIAVNVQPLPLSLGLNISGVGSGAYDHTTNEPLVLTATVRPSIATSSVVLLSMMSMDGAAVPTYQGRPMLTPPASGTVTFYRNGVVIGTAELVDGVASFTTGTLPLGRGEFSVSYSGDANHSMVAPTASAYPITVWSPQAVATQGTLQLPTEFHAGSPATLSVDLRSQSGFPPSGTVTFYTSVNGVLTEYATVSVVNGRAVLSMASVPPDFVPSFRAIYSGDEHNGALDLSGYVPLSVDLAATTVTVSTSSASVAQGETLTLTAQIIGAQASGVVTFYNGSTVLGTAVAVNGVATLQVNTLPTGANAIRAAYAGDGANYASTSTQALAIDITAGSEPTTPLNPIGSEPVQLGASVVGDFYIGASAPIYVSGTVTDPGHLLTGTYSFFDGQTLLGTVSAAPGTPFYAGLLPLGARTLTVVYSGDSYNAGGTTSIAVNVQPLPLSLGLNISGVGSGAYDHTTNEPLVLTATVRPSIATSSVVLLSMMSMDGAAVPTYQGRPMLTPPASGTVTFYRNGVVIGTAELVDGVASFTTGTLPLGRGEFSVSYSGDANHSMVAPTASAYPITVWSPQAVATQGTLQLPTEFHAGSPATLSVDLRSQSGFPPSGTVTFYTSVNGVWTEYATVSVLDGRAVLSMASVPPDFVPSFRAIYNGDEHNGALDLSGYVPLSVDLAPTTITVSSTSAAQGDILTLTAQITGAQASGVVTFYNGSTVLGTAVAVNGVATLQVNTLPVGVNAIRAAYAGDSANYAAVSAQATAVSITRPSILPRLGLGEFGAIPVTLQVDERPVPTGTAVTLTANVTGVGSDGMVTFFSGNTVLGSAPVIDGKAVLLTRELPVGVNSIIASYAGSTPPGAQPTASLSSSVQKIVTRVVPDAGLKVSSNGSVHGEGVTLTMTLTDDPSLGFAFASGEVKFYNGNTLLGTASVIRGVATLTVGKLPAGVSHLRATYAGDAIHEISSAQAQATAQLIPTQEELQIWGSGDFLDLRVSVWSPPDAVTLPSGPVVFYDGDVVIGQAMLVDGVASLRIAVPTSGQAVHFRATYAGSADHAPSETQQGDVAYAAVALTASASQVVQGDSVSLTARVIGNAPQGVVSFFAGVQFLGSAQVVDGVATLVTSYLPQGSSVALSASYAGDDNNTAGIGNGPRLEVSAGAGSVSPPGMRTLTLQAGVATVGSSVLLSASGQTFRPGQSFMIFEGQTFLGRADASSGGGWVWAPPLPAGTHELTVVYDGDFPGDTAAAGTVQVVVQPRGTQLELSSSGTPVPNENRMLDVVKDAPLTLTAQIGGSDADEPSVGGLVTFYSDGVAIGTASVVHGRATLTVNDLPLGLHQITASYSGDSNYGASVAYTSVVQRVVASARVVPSTVALSTVPAPPRVGTPSELTASIGASGGAALPPSGGSVSFYDGSVLLGTADVVDGRATLAVAFPSAGTRTVRAVYSGDAARATSQVELEVKVEKAATTVTALTASATSVTQGQPVTLTAQVSGAAAAGARVSFFAGTQFLGTALVVDGQASFVTTYLPAGTGIAISAAYGSDANLAGSVIAQGVRIDVAVNPGGVQAPAVDYRWIYSRSGSLGDEIRVELPGVQQQDGVVFSIFDGDVLVGNYTAISWNVWEGPSVRIPILPPGVHQITIVSTGGTAAPVSTTFQLSVSKASAIVDLITAPRSQAVAGAPLTLTASFRDFGAAAGIPIGGAVTFYRDGVAIGTAQVVDGLATLTVSDLPLGKHVITAGYAGDANHYPSDPWWETKLAVEVVSSPVSSTASLSAAKDLSLPGAPLVLTAALSGTGGPEAGTVSFYEGTTLLGTAAVVGGSARLVIEGLLTGVHNIRAVYTGDANNLGSSTTAGIIVVKPAAVLTNLTAPIVSPSGDLSVRVGHDNAGGLVSFYEGTHLLGVARVVDGVATLSGAALPPGTHAFTAVYTGDVYSADSELRFTQAVEGEATAIVRVLPDAMQDRTITRLYDRNGQLRGVVDAEGYLTEYGYNAAGEQVRTVSYANRPAGFSDPAARAAAIAIARASGNIAGLRPAPSADDVETRNLYDARGRLVGQVDGEGYLTETVYDARGNVTQSIRYAAKATVAGPGATLSDIRPLGQFEDQRIGQTWSAAGQLLTRTNAEGTVTRFSYDGVGQLVQTVTAEGTADERTSRLRYDIQGRLIGQLDGRGSDAVALNDPLAAWADNGLTHGYDAAGRRISTTDANGHRTLFFYDPIGRLRYTVNAMGEVTESRYSSQGQLIEQIAYGSRVNVVTLGGSTPGGLNTDVLSDLLEGATDAADAHVSYTYNATGTRASATDAVGSVTSYAYNAFREATASIYALNNGAVVTDTASFDRRGLQVRSVKDAASLALTERTTYDAFGRAVERFDANGNRSEAAYDHLGRLIVTTDALGKERHTTYDAFNRVLAQTDALGHITTYGYDTAQRRITITTPEGVTSVTEHDRNGQTQRVTDGRGNVTTYTYDKSGNLLRTDAPEGVSASATYDKAGLKFDSTDANGIKTGYTYDAANRLLTRTLDPVGLHLVTTYGYDPLGRNISVTDARGVVTLTEFDLAGRTVRQVVDPAGLALTTSYVRDTTGNVLSVTDPNGYLTVYTYDGAGRRIKEVLDPRDPNAVFDPWTEKLPPLDITRTYQYDANGNVVRSTDGNGAATNYTYDAANRLVYTLDAVGGVSRTFYDDEGRVVRTVRYATAISLENLPAVPTGADIESRVVAHPTDMVQSRRYDRDGRLHFTVDGTGAVVEYTYDTSNNLIETRAYARRIDLAAWSQDTDPSVVADASDERTRTVYDALNRAVWTVDGSGGVRRNIYDANGNVVENRVYANALHGAAFDDWDGKSAPAVMADTAWDQRVRTVFDAANRAVWQVDGAGGVVHNTYDAVGNVVEHRAYSHALAASVLQAWDGHSPLEPQPDDATDRRIRSVFDAANRATWTVDGAGSVTSNEYDANGNLVLRTQFASSIAEGADPQSVRESDQDRHVRYIYNAANRVDYQSRWQGGYEHGSPYGALEDSREEISYDYDGAGRLLRQTTHSEFPWGPNPTGRTDERDHSNYFVYDAAGRLTYSVNAEGAVTGNTYDGAGRLVRSQQFVSAHKDITNDTRMEWRGELGMDRTLVGDNYEVPVRHQRLNAGWFEFSDDYDASQDRITSMVYDAAGRRTFTVDTLGGVSHNLYDAFGNVVRQIDYAHPVAQVVGLPAEALDDLDLVSLLQPDAGADRVRHFAYDQANRQSLAVDALGGVTRSVYDGIGQLVETRQYAVAIDTADLATPGNAPLGGADLSSRVVSDAAHDRVSRQVFDAAGRPIYGVDALGFVSKSVYDGLGQATDTTKYAVAIPMGTANTADAIAAAVVPSAENDRTKSFEFDALGRVVFARDALRTGTESWTYDALGNKTSYTNASEKLSVWTYEYDGMGRMIREISPQVELTNVVVGPDGRLQVDPANSGMASVVTDMGYDTFGNMTWRTEASGRAESRTTHYRYDRMGRQVGVDYPPVLVYSPSPEGHSPRYLSTVTTYDAFGNAIANRDVAGNYSYKTYDQLGRLTHEVDALGYVTGYMRDAFGDVMALTRYQQAVAPRVQDNGWEGPVVPSAATVAQALNAGGADRTILTIYDRLGRAIEVKEPSATVYDPSAAAGAQYSFDGKTTRNTYNSFGDLVQVAQRRSADSWVLASTNYYDQRGQQVATVDALGYLTTQVFDATGNVVDRTEFARASSGWIGTSNLAGWTGLRDDGDVVAQPAPGADADNDRRVVTIYDRNNRKMSETRKNVEYSTASNGTSTRGDLTTTFGYDAVGNLTRTTDASGASTYSFYDALGRVKAVVEPTRAGSDGSAAVTPITVFHRDAFGNVVTKTEYINGADLGQIEIDGVPLDPRPMPTKLAGPNPEITSAQAAGWSIVGNTGFMSATPFDGGVPVYRLRSDFFGPLHYYTQSIAERDALIASGIWHDEGYIPSSQIEGTVPLYKVQLRLPAFWPPELQSFSAYHLLTTDMNEVNNLVDNFGATFDGVVGYVGEAQGPQLDTGLVRMFNPLVGDHFYVPATVPVDPYANIDLVSSTDRTSFAQYDAQGHVVQSTDAMGVNHYSAYNARGQIAEEYQYVRGEGGTQQKLFRRYEYDDLGRQIRVIDPGNGSDNGTYTDGRAKDDGVYSANPKATVDLGHPASGGVHGQPQEAVNAQVTLQLANTVNGTGGVVKVEFDYVTLPVENPGDDTNPPSTTPGQPGTFSQEFEFAYQAVVPEGVKLALEQPVGSVLAIRILQKDANGNWVSLWQGTPAAANGQVLLNTGDAPGQVVETAMEYNAFGEVVSKSVNGKAGEYFNYDNAGHLWRTNAGDGIDKIALYDLMGRQTAEIRSAGSGRGDLNLVNVGSAIEASQLADVRRSDTTYDLLGRVIVQQLAERASSDDSGVLQRPVVVQTFDRWGNVLSISDPRSTSWVTNYRYNANNQMVVQIQNDSDGLSGVDQYGNITNGNAPVTRIYYDAMGRQVAVRDANDHVNGQVWDAAGNLVRELHADTGVVSHAYDAFGNKVRTIDAESKTTWFASDKLNRLLRTTHQAADIWGWPNLFGPAVVGTSQTTEINTWDDAGRKTSQTNGAGETLRYGYDLRGNVIRITQPLGQVTRSAYDALNRKIIEVDANGALATWKYDYFGQLKGHSDIGGANYIYRYDNARQLTDQTNSRGQNLHYTYDAAGQMLGIDDTGARNAVGASVLKTTRYAYDLAGRHTREVTVQDGVTYQENDISYDALGRMRWVHEGNARANIDIAYDKMGNRTKVRTVLEDPSSSMSRDTTRYYGYDEMNRQTLVDSNTIDGVSLGPDGHRITYDHNGNRVTDTREGKRIVAVDGQWVVQDGDSKEEYGYDALNRLVSTVRDGVTVETRGYDGASRVIVSLPGALDPTYTSLHQLWRGVTNNDPLQARQNMYDANGRMVHQKTAEYGTALTLNGVDYTYDQAGNVLSYLQANVDLENPTFTNTVNTVERAGGYRTALYLSETRVAAGDNKGAILSRSGLGYHYDANGNQYFTGDPGQVTHPTLRTHNFVSDANGNVLSAYYSGVLTPNEPVNIQRQLVVNGEVLGRYGMLSDDRFDGTPLASNGPFFTPQSDFSFGYRPINGSYPSGSPGTYAVGASDTLQSIAKGAYGDASLWYLIADANGLGSSADLKAGQILRIPQATSSANNANTFKPYDPSQIFNDKGTAMAMPRDKGGCGAIGQIIVIVIAAVVTYITAGAAANALPSLGGVFAAGGTATVAGVGSLSLTTAITAGAIGGAVGSIVSQAVGVAIGAQDSFSWKSVALGAIGGGVSAGLGGWDPLGKDQLIGNAIIRGAVGNSLTQGIAIATGLQQSFSWKNVAASAVGAGVGAAVGDALGMNDKAFLKADFGAQFGKRLVTGLAAGAAAAAMRGGRVSVTQVAVDAFGNALGDSLARINSDIPGPVGPDEKARILGYFADSSGSESSFTDDVAARKAAQAARTPLWALRDPFAVALAGTQLTSLQSTNTDSGTGLVSSGAGSQMLEVAQGNLSTMRAIAEGNAENENLIDSTRALWFRVGQLIGYGQDSAGISNLMKNDPAIFAKSALSDAAKSKESLMGFYLNASPQDILNLGSGETLNDAISGKGADRAANIAIQIEQLARTSLLPRLSGLTGAYGNRYPNGEPSIENAVLFPEVASSIGKLDSFTGIVTGTVPFIGQLIGATQLNVRMSTANEMYDIGLLDASSLSQVRDAIGRQKAGLGTDFATSLITMGNPFVKIVGGALLGEDAIGGKATAIGSADRMLVNAVRSLTSSASLGQLAIATQLGRYASLGGAIDAIKASGIGAETYLKVLAPVKGYRTFSVQRANGTNFDNILAKVDPNSGLVSDVINLDVKNTTGVVESITAFGAGAKRPNTYANNLRDAITTLSLSSDPAALEVAAALRNGNFSMAVVTHPNASISQKVMSAVQASTGKTLQQLKWLP